VVLISGGSNEMVDATVAQVHSKQESNITISLATIMQLSVRRIKWTQMKVIS